MCENLAPVKCIVQEKNANIDVEIIRRDRAILYRVQPRKVLTARNEALKWKRPVTHVEELIKTTFERNVRQSSAKVVCLTFRFVCLFYFIVDSSSCGVNELPVQTLSGLLHFNIFAVNFVLFIYFPQKKKYNSGRNSIKLEVWKSELRRNFKKEGLWF